MSILAKPFMKTVPQGAATQCYVAAHPSAAKASGEYFSDCKISKSSAWSRDEALADELWTVSEQLTQDYLG